MRRSVLFQTASFVLLTSLVVAGRSVPSQDPPIQPSGEGLPDGPGKDVVVRVCGVCHQPSRTASVRLTRDGWSDVIHDMKTRGARGSDADFAQVLDYLSTYFLGEAPRPVNVNSAAAIDLESVIGLLRKEAGAIVTYREQHGPFKELEDLKKVPGLDYKKIQAAKDRVVCL